MKILKCFRSNTKIAGVLFGTLLMLVFSNHLYAREGKEIWEKSCLECHASKQLEPKAASYWAGVQWQRFITQLRHKEKILDKLATEERNALLKFLKEHAADSDSPEVAGVR